MPIRINLLAEAQAAEELRRKDPVKRAFVVAGLVIGLVLFWSSTLQIKIIAEKGQLNQLEAKWSSIEKSYKVAVDTRRQSLEAEQKIAALHRYTTNRFLLGTVLDAFQKTVSGNEDVQVVRLKTEQSYTINATSDEARARTNAAHAAGAKTLTSTEKVTMIIDAVDSNPQPGGQGKLKEAIATVPYFQTHLQKTNGVILTSLSAPQVSPLGRNTFVAFTLQCSFQERVR